MQAKIIFFLSHSQTELQSVKKVYTHRPKADATEFHSIGHSKIHN